MRGLPRGLWPDHRIIIVWGFKKSVSGLWLNERPAQHAPWLPFQDAHAHILPGLVVKGSAANQQLIREHPHSPAVHLSAGNKDRVGNDETAGQVPGISS